MSNLERIQKNNGNLRECVSIVKSLPEAGSGLDDTMFARLYEDGVFGNSEVTSLPNDFCRNWNYVKVLDFPNVTIIGTYACYSCINLEVVNMPNCTSIGAYSFYNNTSLKAIDFPSLTSVLGNVFRQCTSATSVNLPVCTSIASNSFQKDALIEKMDFPMLKSIGATAFDQCSALVTFILRSSTLCTLANVSAFNNTPIKDGTGYIYVPASLVDSYKTATNWATYANQIRAIEDYPEICGM